MSLALRIETQRRPHLSVAERTAIGKAERATMPRVRHEEVTLDAGRDPVGQIELEGNGRLADLLPIRHARMLASPLAFYRGTASLMARDLASCSSSSLRVQLCGDAHLSNFGGFASPDRALVFDLNDFDETLPGPFEWDVKRLAASFELAARHHELPQRARRSVVLDLVCAYRRAMRDFATMTNLQVWYSRLDAARFSEVLDAQEETRNRRAFRDTALKAASKARTKDSARALARLTELVDGERRFVSRPPLIVPVDEFAPAEHDRSELEAAIKELLLRYRRTLQHDRRVLFDQYRYVDLAHKVVGVGSVGTRCWIVLLLGKDDEDALVLQVKEASASVLEPYAGKSRYANAGQRVVEGQRLMQAASDIFLGWIRNQAGFDGNVRDFYVRQLWDWKGGVDIDTVDPAVLVPLANVCGWTLARAHARSGDRVAIASYLGKAEVFDKAVAAFASSYADIAEQDFAHFGQAADAGRLAVGEP